jgi:RNA polymerase sigma factor (sigma-70 family)
VSPTPNEVFANDQMDFGGVASRYFPMLFRIALRRLRNVEDAEDAVQDALLSAYKHIGSFEGRAQLSTWLTRIVINVAGMKLRSRPRQEIVSLDQARETARQHSRVNWSTQDRTRKPSAPKRRWRKHYGRPSPTFLRNCALRFRCAKWPACPRGRPRTLETQDNDPKVPPESRTNGTRFVSRPNKSCAPCGRIDDMV